ncbi:MAG: hypothetical protein M1150_02780 [Patescibacteria group bacterium]|nr:hypothetical protein [Patescibacteria group bacterium]
MLMILGALALAVWIPSNAWAENAVPEQKPFITPIPPISLCGYQEEQTGSMLVVTFDCAGADFVRTYSWYIRKHPGVDPVAIAPQVRNGDTVSNIAIFKNSNTIIWQTGNK